MNKYLILLMVMMSMLILSACDTQEHLNKPRTMIIGGVPVYDHDYKLPQATSATTKQHK